MVSKQTRPAVPTACPPQARGLLVGPGQTRPHTDTGNQEASVRWLKLRLMSRTTACKRLTAREDVSHCNLETYRNCIMPRPDPEQTTAAHMSGICRKLAGSQGRAGQTWQLPPCFSTKPQGTGRCVSSSRVTERTASDLDPAHRPSSINLAVSLRPNAQERPDPQVP